MPPRPDTVHIATAANDTYAMGLAVMLRSAVSALDGRRSLKAHVLNRRLSPENRERVLRSLPAGRVDVSWITVPPGCMPDVSGRIRGFDWITVEAYDRLLLPELLPDLDKVIYLDADLVVLRDPGRLWDLDPDGALLLAVPETDPDCRYVSSRKGIARHAELGLREDLEVFNSGVMVLDLAEWRRCHVTRQVFDYLHATEGEGGWHDQDALNAVAAGRWGKLDPSWNVTMHRFRAGESPGEPDVAASTSILHFNSSVKPWQSGFPFDCGELFFRHLDETAWRGWRPEQSPLLDLIRRGRRALSKGRERLRGLLRIGIRKLEQARAGRREVRLVAGRPVPFAGATEIRVFLEGARLDSAVRDAIGACQEAGADRVLLLLEQPVTGTADHERVHVFSRSAAGDLRRLLDQFGVGHWCLVLRPDERLLPLAPGSSAGASLRETAARLEEEAAEALECRLVEPADAAARRSGARDGRDPDGPALSWSVSGIARVETIFRDPERHRLFRASADFEAGPAASGRRDRIRSRVALFRYRMDMLAAPDFRAAAGVRLAEARGTLVRVEASAADHSD
jgi:lipopolysaccharide biosynthesis glycosyltransferase